MRPLAFGLLCALPPAAWFAFRYARIRRQVDARAGRSFLAKAVAFTAAAALLTGALYAARGSYPLPLVRLLLLVGCVVALLLGFLKD